MVLKEAFRYQNYLTELTNDIGYFLSQTDNIVILVKNHQINSTNSDKKDFTEIGESEYDTNKVIDLLIEVLQEKEAITKAIYIAKANCGYDIDGLLSINKYKNSLLNSVNILSNLKNKETKEWGTDYKFNNDGEQYSYKYPINTTTEINFDKNKVKELIKKLQSENTEVSNLVDKLNVTVEVNFSPKYDTNESFKDMLENFIR